MNSCDFLNLVMDEFQLHRFVEECEWDAPIETDIVNVNWNDDLNDDSVKFWTNCFKDSAYHKCLERVLEYISYFILTKIHEIEILNNNEIVIHYESLWRKFNLFELIIDSSYMAIYETYNIPPGFCHRWLNY
jgi:hypothetical protein